MHMQHYYRLQIDLFAHLHFMHVPFWFCLGMNQSRKFVLISDESRHSDCIEIVGLNDSFHRFNDGDFDQNQFIIPDHTINTTEIAKRSYNNFLKFCIFYSVTHATVDAVLAFSTAELGAILGSWGGFALYVSYTLSSLFLARPCLRVLGAKGCVFSGLLGLLCYVFSFFLAILFRRISLPIFIIGAVIGGIGAGTLWTGNCHSQHVTIICVVDASCKHLILVGYRSRYILCTKFAWLRAP